jgi:hypothetical protein
MKIVVDVAVMLRLMTIDGLYPREFSGFGFCEKEGDTIRIYDFVLLDVGSEVFTEIPTEKIIGLMGRPDVGKMKVWVHAHPLGDGNPGQHNWSGTDENTIQHTPLGGIPELVKWSVSMVLTPRGWVGRIDNYVSQKTLHLPVEPQAAEAYDMLGQVLSTKRVEVRPDPFVIFSPRSMTSLDDFDDIEDRWNEEDEELDMAYEAMDECGVTVSDLVEMGWTPEQFHELYLRNHGDPDATLDDFLSAGVRQPYLSQEFQRTQIYLGGDR